MKCPKCNVEMSIKTSKNILDVSGDNPRLFRKSILTCRNKQCTNYGTDVESVKNELQLSKDDE